VAEASGAPAPGRAYAAGVARGAWQDDPAQHPALAELDRIHATVLADASGQGGLLARMLGRDRRAAIPGLYLWGGVGRGKTFLIDLFYDGLPLKDAAAEGRTYAPRPRSGRGGDRPRSGWWGEGASTSGDPSPASGRRCREAPDEGKAAAAWAGRTGAKHRTHFHRFMREVHAQLRAHAGEHDPLAAVAADWGRRLRVLVLDEFFVSDIGDAMLLARLLEGLFAQGTVLVTSSNTPPQALYRGGLQRARFLPAIELIERHCRILELDSDTDYRLRALTRSPVYRAPLDDASDDWLRARWEELTAGVPREAGPLSIDGRDIPVRALAEGQAWFDFADLCEGPRATGDYIEIAREHHSVLLGGIPRFDGSNDDPARRFVHLVDEFYDRHVNLVCTADAAPPALYTGERLAAAFERTASRLVEMQSAGYLALEHRG
jgi:cell division protein ZapE